MHRYRPPDFDGHPSVPIRVHETPPDKPTYFFQEFARLFGPQPPNPVIMDQQGCVRTSAFCIHSIFIINCSKTSNA